MTTELKEPHPHSYTLCGFCDVSTQAYAAVIYLVIQLEINTEVKFLVSKYRFTRVVFGMSSSPFLLNVTVKYHLERFLDSNEATVNHLLRSTYVDDIISGADSDEEAFELYTKPRRFSVKEVLNSGSFCPTANRYRPRLTLQKG